MRVALLCGGIAATNLLLGCKYDCTRYRDQVSVRGQLTQRESSGRHEARAADDGGDELARTTISSDDMTAHARGRRGCLELDCTELRVYAGNVMIRVSQPDTVGAYPLEALGARLCERYTDGELAEEYTYKHCSPAHGQLVITAVDVDCNNDSGHDSCSWLEARLDIEEDTDLTHPSLSGSVHVVLDTAEYEGTCGGGFGVVPTGPG